jgi:hypothetical protein
MDHLKIILTGSQLILSDKWLEGKGTERGLFGDLIKKENLQ